MELSQVTLGAVLPEEEARFRAVMGTHHYLGAAPKVGETLWYGAAVAAASGWRWRRFSAAALKCQARDAWIGWTLRHKYDRLHLVANNTRFVAPAPGSQSRVPGAGAVRTPSGAGLAGTLSSSAGAAGDLRGPVAVRGHGLPGRGLDRGRHDARLPPCPGRVPRRVDAEEATWTVP